MTPEEIVKALERAGLRVVRQTGSHIIMYRAGALRPVPVPRHPKSLKRTLQNRIIREAGFTIDEFKRFL